MAASTQKCVLTRLPELHIGAINEAELLRQKIAQCKHIFDFLHRPQQHATIFEASKIIKHDALKELSEYAVYADLPTDLYDDIFDMIFLNIFRTPPPKDQADNTLTEATRNNEWYHLEYVYKLLINLMRNRNFQPPYAGRLITDELIDFLLQCLHMYSRRGRQLVKKLIMEIYGSFLIVRRRVRKQLQDYLLQIINNEIDTAGLISDVLQMCGKIMENHNSDGAPLRKFFNAMIIPCHGHRLYRNFWNELTRCCLVYLDQNPMAVNNVVASIFKYWANSPTMKRLYMADELRKIVDNTEEHFLDDVMPQIYDHAVKWMNTSIKDLMCKGMSFFEPPLPEFYRDEQYKEVLFRRLVFGLKNVTMCDDLHLQKRAFKILAILDGMDSDLCKIYIGEFRTSLENADQIDAQRKHKWAQILELAKKNPKYYEIFGQCWQSGESGACGKDKSCTNDGTNGKAIDTADDGKGGEAAKDLGGLTIKENLDLGGVTIKENLDLGGVTIKENLDLGGVTIKENLDLGGVTIKENLDLGGVTIMENLALGGVTIKENLDLGGVAINEHLDLANDGDSK